MGRDEMRAGGGDRKAVADRWLGSIWGDWARLVAITSVIWAVSCVGSGDLEYYWPIWIGGPWGAILLLQTIGGLSNGAPARFVENEKRKELAKQRKQVRKMLEARRSRGVSCRPTRPPCNARNLKRVRSPAVTCPRSPMRSHRRAEQALNTPDSGYGALGLASMHERAYTG